MDLGVPKRILLLLYTYDSDTKIVFLHYSNIKFSVHDKTLQLNNSNWRLLLTGILEEKGWTFVLVSCNKTFAEAQLWIDGNMMNSTRFLPKLNSQGSHESLTLRGKGFKGNITQLMLFFLTLTKEQIQGIKERLKMPDKIVSYSNLKRDMTSYGCSKTYNILN